MKAADSSATFRDPVCGMQLKEDFTHRYEFPEMASLNRPPSPPPARAAGGKSAIYTCPMHPEVRQSGPGSCPKCGMTLEPVGVAFEETGNPALADMTRRFWVSGTERAAARSGHGGHAPW